MDLDTNPNLPSTKQCALEPHRIPHLPPSFYYIPSFISPEEESSLLSKVAPLPINQNPTPNYIN
jgi:hypothetical protein